MSDRGKLLILDRIFPNRIEPDTDVQGKVLIDLTMMVRTGGGRERTIAEFQSLLAASRLRFVRAIPLDNFEHLIEAVPYNTDADAC